MKHLIRVLLGVAAFFQAGMSVDSYSLVSACCATFLGRCSGDESRSSVQGAIILCPGFK